MDRTGALVVGAVSANLALTLLHGGVHASIPVPVTGWQTAYVAVVLFGVPIAGVVLLVGGRSRYGAFLIAVAMALGFTFEGLAHFVVPNPDHVANVESGRRGFETTAALSTGADAVVLLLAVRFLSDRRSQ